MHPETYAFSKSETSKARIRYESLPICLERRYNNLSLAMHTTVKKIQTPELRNLGVYLLQPTMRLYAESHGLRVVRSARLSHT